MGSRPRIADDQIAACLYESYGVSARQIEPLSLGLDAEAAVFRVEATDQRSYFFKLKRGRVSELCVTVPRVLRAAGIQQVVAPLPTRTAAPWGVVGEHAALLYPYLHGWSGFVRGLTPAQWSGLGEALARIHALKVPASIADALPREQFVLTPRWANMVRAILAGEHLTCQQDEPARELRAFLAERHAEIRSLLERAETLGQMLQRRTVERVLCHADIHIGNVLIGDRERVHIVDWDRPVLAPRECDLMLLIGPAIRGFSAGSPEEAAFFAGYGEATVDPLTMAYYRYERACSDLGAFAAEVYWLPDADEAAKHAAVRWVSALFQPDGIVDMAYRSEADLPS
jgi:spectinomycin phosphotransferase